MNKDDIDLIGLGNKIARMRMSRNMTQFELAENAGLSEVYIGYLEQGKRRGALGAYVKIVNALGYTLDDLVSEYLTNKDSVAIDLRSLLENCKAEEQKIFLRLIRDMVALVKPHRTD